MQPKITYTDVNETGCCPKPNVRDWDKAEVKWKDKMFVRDTCWQVFHIPVTLGQMMKRITEKIERAKAMPPTKEFIMLSFDPSPWKGEHYLAVTKKVPEAENVKISGRFLTRVFEGEFKNAPKWVEEMDRYVKSKKEEMKKMYFFYTTCPKCAKYYGKNYVVGLAQVE